MRKMILLTMVIVCVAGLLSAQSVNRGAFNIMGAGARAMGMGGAFTAIADDATAASWNPAGLAQLRRPEASLVYDTYSGEINYGDEGYTEYPDAGLANYYEDRGDQTDLDYDALSFASFLYPFTAGGRNIVTQFSYSRISNFADMSNSFHYWYDWAAGDTSLYTAGEYYDVETSFSGGIDAYTFSLASDLSAGFHLGLSINYVKADVDRTETVDYYYENSEGDTESDAWENRFGYEFNDFHFDIGFLWKMSEQFSLGGVYHSGFKADADFTWDAADTYSATVEWPTGWALGLAYRPLPSITLALDYSERSWSEGKVDWDDEQYLDTTFPYLNFDRQFDTSSLRFGFEYAWVLANHAVIPFRLGYFQEDQIASYFVGGDQPDSTGYTAGTGFAFGNFQLDLAYVHSEADTEEVYGETAGVDPDLGNYTGYYYGSFDSTIDRIIVSAIVRF